MGINLLLSVLLFLCSSQAKVVFVLEVCRHGSRAPTVFFPWDDDGRWANIPLGELTPVGMRQHFLLGSELRYRYIEQEQVLDENYLASNVYFRSTDFNRTIMSGQSQIMGLYPTGPLLPTNLIQLAEPPITIVNEANIIQGLNGKVLPNQFQVFPVHVFPILDDLLLLSYAICTQLLYNLNSPPITDAMNQTAYSNEWVLNVLENEGVTNPGYNLSEAVDNILCNQAMNFSLPANFTPEFLQNATNIFNEIFALQYQDDRNARLFSSSFFLDLLQHLEAVVEGTEPNRFILYAAHDITVAGFLAGMQVYDQKQPPFASSLIYEVSEEYSKFYIRVIYNDKVLTIPTCNSTSCPLSVFMTYLRLRTFPNSTEVCSLTSSTTWGNMKNAEEGNEGNSPTKGSGNVTWVGWFLIGLTAGVLLIALCACAAGKLKKTKEEKLLLDFDDSRSSKSSESKVPMINVGNEP